MIEAQIKSIVPGGSGRDAKAFARSHALISPENLSGEVMFYVAPPFWTGGRPPHLGQQIQIGQLVRKTSPYWPQPKRLARDVSSAYSTSQNSSGPVLESMRGRLDATRQSWLARLLASFGLRPVET